MSNSARVTKIHGPLHNLSVATWTLHDDNSPPCQLFYITDSRPDLPEILEDEEVRQVVGKAKTNSWTHILMAFATFLDETVPEGNLWEAGFGFHGLNTPGIVAISHEWPEPI